MSIRLRHLLLLVCCFASGAVALVYQVLWLKELQRLFGSTAQAAGTTLAVFFLGLACGGWLLASRVSAMRRPARVYVWLEVAIGGSAILYFGLHDAFSLIYPALYGMFGAQPWMFAAVKFLLAACLLFLPAFCMGGTLPVLTAMLINGAYRSSSAISLLYGLNTAGAVCGAALAGFILPAALGFRGAYLSAIAGNLLIAAAAWAVSRGDVPVTSAAAAPVAEKKPLPFSIWLVAFVSGALTIGMEVLWTRMFAQTLQNSVYSFALILIVFLCGLTLAAWLAAAVCRLPVAPGAMLAVLCGVAGIAAAVVPFRFVSATGGLQLMALGQGWSDYLPAVTRLVGGVLLPPVLAMGVVFPYLLRAAEHSGRSPGELVGRLAAVNTFGAILGSVLAGFVLSEYFGLWRSQQILAASYGALGLLVVGRQVPYRWVFRAVPAAALFGVCHYGSTAALPMTAAGGGMTVKQLYEGSHGIVAVVEKGGDRLLNVNNHYNLGSSNRLCLGYQQMQSHVPILLHPHPKKVFMIGLATGISASGALDHRGVEQVTIAELVPEVVTAAREHFSQYNRGLLDDPRVTVIPDDGRNVLQGMTETYDVITCDLVVPWHVGASNLYTREHYETVKSRLAPAGIFAQWLPLYQMTEQEFGIVARTMLEVFPRVTVWRADFFGIKPVVGLVARLDDTPLEGTRLEFHGARLTCSPDIQDTVPASILETPSGILVMYGGDLTAVRDWFEEYPLNTDDKPVLEYLAPQSAQEVAAGQAEWFWSDRLGRFFDRLAEWRAAHADPFISKLAPAQRDLIQAGLYRYWANVHWERQDSTGGYYFDQFKLLVPPSLGGSRQPDKK